MHSLDPEILFDDEPESPDIPQPKSAMADITSAFDKSDYDGVKLLTTTKIKRLNHTLRQKSTKIARIRF